MASQSRALQSRAVPIAVGAATLVGTFVILEILLRVGVVNRYIVPLPSDVLLSLERIIVEEGVVTRARETAYEMFMSCMAVIIIGVPIGTVLYRYRPMRQALMDWVAALAAAPLVLAFPLFLVMFGRSSTTVIVMSVINDLAERYDLPGTYAAIGFVILVSIVFFVLLERLEKWLRPAT